MPISATEVVIPKGYFQVDSSIIPRGMGSYLKSMMKSNAARQEYGAVVNSKSITCIIENGQLVCARENTCFMVKVKSPKPPVKQNFNDEALKRKNDNVTIGEFKKLLLIDESEKEVIPKVIPLESPEDISFGIEIRVDELTLRSTKCHADIPMCDELSSGYAEAFGEELWEEYIPNDDQARLYDYLGSVKTGTEIDVLIGGEPGITVAFGQADANLTPGRRVSETGIFITMSNKFQRAQEFALPGPGGFLIRLLTSPYYLIYWIFLLIEVNLGYKLDVHPMLDRGETHFIKL